ncbi:MAG: SlyX family protein [Candidatus Riflebacteria bacterium]|nr:SlyX family protein [Candidatus Riflebacteria bacterium]
MKDGNIMDENRIYEVEKRIAYLEKFVEELNEVIINHERTIEALKAEIIELKNKDEQSPLLENRPHNEKPPHY